MQCETVMLIIFKKSRSILTVMNLTFNKSTQGNYCDSIHNHEYHYFYYRDSTITQQVTNIIENL